MRKPLILSILFCITLCFRGEGQHHFFEQISPSYGFVHDGIRTLTEDSNGFLWYGSSNGVYFYNTSEIKKIEMLRLDSTRITSPNVIKIQIDNKNKIWVCTKSGLFKYDEKKNFIKQIKLYFPNKSPITKSRVNNIIQIDENKHIIHIKGKNYLYQEHDSLLQKIDYKTRLNNRHITHICKDKTNLLLGTSNGEVYCIKKHNNTPQLIYSSKKSNVSTICKDGNKYFIGYREEGVDVINLNGKKIEEYNTNQKGKNKLHGNLIRQIIKTNEGEIWIGAYTGLTILKNGKTIHYNHSSNVGLPNSSIYSFHKGKNGGIWISTWAGGIAYFKDYNYRFAHVTPLSKDGSKFENVITSFSEDEEGNIWISSKRKGASLLKTTLNELGRNTTPIYNYKYQINNINTLKHLGNNIMAIATFNEGFFLYNTKTEKIEQQFSMVNNKLTTAYNNNALWIGGYDSKKNRFF